ncbi:MAG: hydrogenase maturation nickel metallochaperone HypA [Halodesulfurarchaeum sp.]
MHEYSIATSLVDRATDTATEHGADTVEAITVAVGKATHLNPTQLRFCIETVATDTILADATITIETVPPRGECDCGWTGEPDRLEDAATYVPDPVCPACGDRVDLTAGRGCRLASIDIPDTHPTQA